MTSLTLATRDSATMLRRNLKQQLRYPISLQTQIMLPVLFLLLFVYVFGETMGAGLPGAGSGAGRADYLAFIVPGVLVFTITGAAINVAVSVASDMTTGIAARFRTMAISRASVLTGHVLGTLIQTLIAVPIVVAVALALGFRPTAGALEWLAVLGVIVLVTLAVVWLSVALGLKAKTIESASNLPMPVMLLPFFGSGFVPTDSMPAGLRWFAEYQPFTPIIDLLRALLLDGQVGNSAWLTIVWCLGIALVGYGWAKRLYAREPAV
jgi:ABC-2 type transport system permease protein